MSTFETARDGKLYQFVLRLLARKTTNKQANKDLLAVEVNEATNQGLGLGVRPSHRPSVNNQQILHQNSCKQLTNIKN